MNRYDIEDSLDIIDLQTVKKLQGVNPMGLSAHWDNSLEMITLQSVNSFQGLTQWDLVTVSK